MSPNTRRVLQALLYEAIAIAVVGPLLSVAFDKSHASTLGLAVVLSSIALTWNYAFNWLFERWESRQSVRGRSFVRRLAHGAGFEGGLVIILLSVMSLWLDISPTAALVANLSLLAFFFFYAIAFTWCFDGSSDCLLLPKRAMAIGAERAAVKQAARAFFIPQTLPEVWSMR